MSPNRIMLVGLWAGCTTGEIKIPRDTGELPESPPVTSDSEERDSGGADTGRPTDDSTPPDSDTGTAPPPVDDPTRCDGVLPGVDTVKWCGRTEDEWAGARVSVGVGAADGLHVAIGTYLASVESLEETNRVVYLPTLTSVSGWFDEGPLIQGVAGEDYAWFGWDLLAGSDIDGDGYGDLVVGAFASRGECEYSGEVTDCTGRVYTYLGPDLSGRTVTDSDAVVMGWGVLNYFGQTLATVGDLDGDGDDETLVGGAINDPSQTSLLTGPIETMSRLEAAATYSSDGNGGPGSDVGAADLDADGVPELLLVDRTRKEEGIGAVWIIPSDLRGGVAVHDHPCVCADDDASLLGLALTTGDVNADGYADFAIDLFDPSDGPGVILGPIPRSVGLSDMDAMFLVDTVNYTLFPQIVGDLDGDGVSGDLLIGSGNPSALYLLPAPLEAGTYTPDTTLQITSRDSATGLGYAMAPLPDMNGDGVDDALIGEPGDSEGATEAGAVYLLYGASW